MAQLSKKLDVRFSWWVKPYLDLLMLFVLTVGPFLDEDDERIDEFLARQSQFICRHGVHFSLS